MFKFSFIPVFLFAVPLVVKAQNDTLLNRKLSLSTCIETALKNNLAVRQSNIQTQIQRVGYLQSKAELLPKVSGGYSQGMNFGRSIDAYTNSYINQENTSANTALNGSLTLFNGFALFNGIKRNSLSYQTAGLDEQQAKDNLMLRVILAYWNVLTNEELLSQTFANKEVSERRLAQAEVQNKEGAIEPRVYYDLKANYSGNQVAYITAVNDLEDAKLRLSQLMNIPYSKALSVEPLSPETELATTDFSAKQVYDDALKSLARVQAADLRSRTASVDINLRRAGYYPVIFLNGGFGSNYSSTASRDILIGSSVVESPDYVEISGAKYPVNVQQPLFRRENLHFREQLKNNRSSYFSLSLSIPIFNSFNTRSNVAIAKLNKKDAELVAGNVRLELQQLTEEAYYSMNFSKERYVAFAEQVNSLAESFRTAEVKFSAGAINSVDYLVAKNAFDNARLDLIRSRYNYILRKQIVEYYRGNRSF